MSQADVGQPCLPAERPTKRHSGICPTSIALSWDNLCYRVKDREILKGLTGRAIPGRTLAVMGSSGAGKTTFLNAVSGRLATDKQHELGGSIRLNEITYRRAYRSLFGFVPQDDVIGHTSTPATAFRFALRIRRGTSGSETKVIVDETLEELRLTHVRNTMVGTPGITQGLSGGERKRANIGVELVADTKLLLLDEPTSGLDSNTAAMVVQTLQEIARLGRTVIFTVHQPTAEMLASFDDLMLLTDGKVVYHGPMSNAVEYFDAIGYSCPEDYTPTDYFMVLLQDPDKSPILIEKWEAYLATNGIEQTQNTKDETPLKKTTTTEAQSIKMALHPVPLSLTPVPAIGASEDPENTTTMKFIRNYITHTGSGWRVQFVELGLRAFRNVYFNYQYVIIILLQHIVFAVIVAAIFHNLKDDITGTQDRMGMLFMVSVSMSMNTAMGTLNNFAPQKPLYIREQQSGAYSPFIYFLTTFVAELPLFAFAELLESIIIFFSSGLQLSATSFFTFYAALVFTSQTSASLGILVGAAVANDVLATALVPMIVIPMLLAGGLLATTQKLTPYWIWLARISMVRFCYMIVMHNEFERLGNISCDVQKFGPVVCANSPRSGQAVLEFFEFDGPMDQPWVMWISLAVMFLFFRILGLIAMYIIARTKF